MVHNLSDLAATATASDDMHKTWKGYNSFTKHWTNQIHNFNFEKSSDEDLYW